MRVALLQSRVGPHKRSRCEWTVTCGISPPSSQNAVSGDAIHGEPQNDQQCMDLLPNVVPATRFTSERQEDA